jgi:hypothetical protein
MDLAGKYDFPGIKKAGAVGLRAALVSTAWGAILLTTPVVRALVNFFLEMSMNWLANKGLMVMNVGAIVVDGYLDQRAFDLAMEQAISKAENQKGKLTPAEMKAIDDEVIKAARKFLRITPN